MTKPSRPTSNGRLACPGSSFRVDIARMMAKAPKQSGASGASAPPASMMSASPRTMARNAVADGDGARRAAHPVGGVGAGAAELDGDVAARRAGEDGEGERRVDRAWSLGEERVIVPLPVRHAAEGGAHHRAHPIGVLPGEVEPGVGEGHPGGRDGELGIPVQPARPPLLDVIGGHEVLHLAGDARLERGRVEPRDAADRRRASPESVPQPVDSQPDRGDGPDSRDHHPPCVAHAAPASTARRMPASVRDAIPWMNTGPMTHVAAGPPMTGQRGPVQS